LIGQEKTPNRGDKQACKLLQKGELIVLVLYRYFTKASPFGPFCEAARELNQLWIACTVGKGSRKPKTPRLVMPQLIHHLIGFLLSPNNRALHFPLTLLLVFTTAKLLANICEVLGQPGLVGEIVAGVILGPSVLNWVQPDDVLNALAELGVMFLLFRVGLEVKASDLMRVGRTAFLVAVAGVLLPFLAGWACMQAIGSSHIEAIFVAAALVATSVGITAQVLAAKGLLHQRASQIILAAAVIDDVLGLLVLALVSSIAEGHLRIGALVTTAALAGGFTLLVAKYGTSTMRRVLPPVERRLTVAERQFHLALFLLFTLSLLATYVGVAAIVGAFLAGMALSETVERRVHDLSHGIGELLVPFFLVGIGLHLDLGVFASRSTLILSAVILIAAVLSKFVGCGLGGWSLGRADSIRVGVGMVPRGEVGMVIAQIGMSLGVIDKPVYAAVVFMAVGTTLIAPPLLNYVYRDCPREEPELIAASTS
jgi:Kef-type K+ transport system membrane component KefB